ncbi:DUF6354 family protein (plasmid) [Streptomyces sp. NBC_00445]|uniref:DUF6354 family protein n=1 Tax=Streptomyces sp. NBC_00445 TaxID=2975745 RepID=UPI002E1A13F6
MHNRHPSPAAAACHPPGTTVAVGQLWQDMAPDMVSRDRRLRVTGIDGEHAECVVEHDSQGTAGRMPRIAVRRFSTSAFRLLEDCVAPADRTVYARLLKAMAAEHRTGASPAAYASAALAVFKEHIVLAPVADHGRHAPHQ